MSERSHIDNEVAGPLTNIGSFEFCHHARKVGKSWSARQEAGRIDAARVLTSVRACRLFKIPYTRQWLVIF